MSYKNFPTKYQRQRNAVKNWMSYVSQNYADTLPIYFDHWVRFTKYIEKRPPLLTTTDIDIFITDVIFNKIQRTQKLNQQRIESQKNH
tara:strand:+ start:346 stop:609 length:264 start_codon:yes stop_codon:yes gene_type:complete